MRYHGRKPPCTKCHSKQVYDSKQIPTQSREEKRGKKHLGPRRTVQHPTCPGSGRRTGKSRPSRHGKQYKTQHNKPRRPPPKSPSRSTHPRTNRKSCIEKVFGEREKGMNSAALKCNANVDADQPCQAESDQTCDLTRKKKHFLVDVAGWRDRTDVPLLVLSNMWEPWPPMGQAEGM
jgi:hypothetical protein